MSAVPTLLQPVVTNVHPEPLQEYVLASEPQAFEPQLAVIGTPPTPVPWHEQLVMSGGPDPAMSAGLPPQPGPANAQPEALQEYVLSSGPHAV